MADWWTGVDGLSSASFVACDPPEPTFTREWAVNFIAADATSSWDATYTILQEFTGDEDLWSIPEGNIPPNFVQTAVKCANCAEPTVTITCPNVLGTEAAVVVGNGVWATVAPEAVAGGEPGRIAAVSGAGDDEGYELVEEGSGVEFDEPLDDDVNFTPAEAEEVLPQAADPAPAGVSVPTGTEEKAAFATAGAGTLTLKKGLLYGLALGLAAFL
ncbi:hypothetical protein QBC40DRAFT_261710 [Triangularia verruculosa]|uniref:Uncharacterized protein n=1 Tax=Triangularia verruculosa TaxID=2587418 RepID=A0AAN6XP41_9PEZI|nr:hypothetical protein QBC40DRAFT_261710 [Triangularia verruculosa]